MQDKRMKGYGEIERIFFLMANPDIPVSEYMRRFEVSKRTFFRDKQFVANRLWNYKVIGVANGRII